MSPSRTGPAPSPKPELPTDVLAHLLAFQALKERLPLDQLTPKDVAATLALVRESHLGILDPDPDDAHTPTRRAAPPGQSDNLTHVDRCVTAFRHTTVSTVPRSLNHSTTTTRSFHPRANAATRSAARSGHDTHAHTGARC